MAETDKRTAKTTVRLRRDGRSLVLSLPLFTPKGMVRVKRAIPSRESAPVFACSQELASSDYFEWQIGYDTADAAAASRVPAIEFQRKGKRRYGFELSWLLAQAAETNLIGREVWLSLRRNVESSNDMIEDNEVVLLNKAPGPIQNLENQFGFVRYEESAAVYLKQTAESMIEIRVAQRQFAAGSQAMVFLRVPIQACVGRNGRSLVGSTAFSGEYADYVIDETRAVLISDLALAFALASKQHADDIRRILDILKL